MGAVDYGSHLPVPVAISSGEAEYISAAIACIPIFEPSRIIIDNEAAIAMPKCNKDTAGNRHVAGRYHYVRQGTSMNEHKFEWIGTKFQLADTLTKPGKPGPLGTCGLFNWQMSIIIKMDNLYHI